MESRRVFFVARLFPSLVFSISLDPWVRSCEFFRFQVFFWVIFVDGFEGPMG